MMTWKYTWIMNMCLSVKLAEIMPKWQLSALNHLDNRIHFFKEPLSVYMSLLHVWCVSNYGHIGNLFSSLLRPTTKKTSKYRIIVALWWESIRDGWVHLPERTSSCICTRQYVLNSEIRHSQSIKISNHIGATALFAQVVYVYRFERRHRRSHYCDVIMGAMASQITSLPISYLTVYSGADQRKHQSSASLAFVRGIHRWPVNSPHKGPVTRKCFHLMTSSW